jgi:hypothetical protein
LGERVVLLVARTLVSAIRLLEIPDLFQGDLRITWVVTINGTSAFSNGIPELLRRHNVNHIVPWEEVAQAEEPWWDLVLSASENLDFGEFPGRVIVLPHGLGFNKYVPDSGGEGLRLAGLPPAEVLSSGRVVLVLTHPAQEAQLLPVCPEVAGHTVDTGDPMMERLLASMPLRDRHRRALRAGGRTVVMVNSTWSKQSGLGRWPALLRDLLAELPTDEYVVCAAIHPAVWAFHDHQTVLTWFARERASGLVLLPPDRGWQAALLAADVLISDHGSMSLHGCGLDVPLLLTGFGTDVVPDTPVDLLGTLAQRLRTDRSLREQVDKCVVSHQPGRFIPVTDQVFAHIGDATDRLCALIYRELGLAPLPDEPILARVPDLDSEVPVPQAFQTCGHFTAADTITLWRYPAAVSPSPYADYTGQHLVVDESEIDRRLAQKAYVLTRRDADTMDAADDWAQRMLAVYPGAEITAAATEQGCVARLRDGRGVTVTARDVDPMVLASVVCFCLDADRLGDAELRVRIAGHETLVSLRLHDR